MQKRGGTAFFIAIRVIVKFLLHRKIKRKPPLHFLMGPSCSSECGLGYVMPKPHITDV